MKKIIQGTLGGAMGIPGGGNRRDSLLEKQPAGRHLREQGRQFEPLFSF